MSLRALTLRVALLLLGGSSATAYAATLQVAPVLVSLNKGEQAAAIYLSNTGQDAIQAQIRVAQWQQVDGKDTLTPATDVVSSPAMTRLGPGQKQLVRVVALTLPTDNQQHSYRLLIDELPDPQSAHHGDNAVHFLLRYSIPVFINGDAQASGASLTCAYDAHRHILQFTNSGQQYARLSEIALLSAAGATLANVHGLAGYALAGSHVDIPVSYHGSVTPASLTLHLNSHNHDCELISGSSASAASGRTSSAPSRRG